MKRLLLLSLCAAGGLLLPGCAKKSEVSCALDGECLDDYQCVSGACTLCPTCAAGQVCVGAVCVAKTCGGVTCRSGEGCVGGHCTDNDCQAVVCPAGQACARGLCYPVACPSSADCGAFSVCWQGACVTTNCVDVACDAGQVCGDGQCIAQDCSAGLPCAVGSACVAGRCTSTSCVGVTCAVGSICVAGACTAVPTCGGQVCPEGQVCDSDVCKDPALTVLHTIALSTALQAGVEKGSIVDSGGAAISSVQARIGDTVSLRALESPSSSKLYRWTFTGGHAAQACDPSADRRLCTFTYLGTGTAGELSVQAVFVDHTPIYRYIRSGYWIWSDDATVDTVHPAYGWTKEGVAFYLYTVALPGASVVVQQQRNGDVTNTGSHTYEMWSQNLDTAHYSLVKTFYTFPAGSMVRRFLRTGSSPQWWFFTADSVEQPGAGWNAAEDAGWKSNP